MQNKLVSPIAKAKGLGPAHHGTEHKLLHNITTLLNIPLVAWVMYSVYSLRNANYEQFTAWMAHPFSIVVFILFVVVALKHFALELQVVYEDYVSNRAFRMIKVVGMKIFFVALGITTIVSILKIAFQAGA
jgi:succinate dehydrogenase / fumarate reductase membrane anchor subunit